MTNEDKEVWEYVLAQRLQPYVERARKWWEEYESLIMTRTGVFPIKDAPPGMMYRITNTPVRSPIKGVQAFPFVPVPQLNISNVPGGVTKMVTNICSNDFCINEFVIIEKNRLQATYNQGQILCLIPKKIIDGASEFGRFVYISMIEMESLKCGIVTDSLLKKINKDT